jgi:hypothetical protein
VQESAELHRPAAAITSRPTPETFARRGVGVMKPYAIPTTIRIFHIQAGRIGEVHRIVLSVTISIEALRISRAVAAFVRVGLIKAGVPAVI